MNNKVKNLMGRLWDACRRKPELGGDLWGRGIEVIQRKYGVRIWLSGFESEGAVEGDPATGDPGGGLVA